MAKYLALPIDRLHIVTNENDILHRTISEGKMKIDIVKKTYSPSMDIQISSNFERQLFESANRDSDLIKKTMQSFLETGEHILSNSIVEDMKLIYNTHTVSNLQTLKTIRKFKEKFNYLADPHTATGLNVLDKMNNENSTIGLACAHPAKFGEAIKEATGNLPNFPSELKNIFDKEEKMVILNNNIQDIKNHINNNI